MLSNDNQKVITNQYLTLLLINNGFENGLSHGHKCYVKLNEADTIKSKDESIDSENENTSNGMALIIIDGPFYVTRAEHIPLVTTSFNGQKKQSLDVFTTIQNHKDICCMYAAAVLAYPSLRNVIIY